MGDSVTWEFMVEHYPDSWIAVSDAVMDGPDIVSGSVHAVLSDDEIIDYEARHRWENLVFRRTNGESNGPVRANFIIETA